jgi:hypothetical protein
MTSAVYHITRLVLDQRFTNEYACHDIIYAMFSVNGIGTKIYGKDDEAPDGSYVTTKWFVILFLPIVPLGSYRVSESKIMGTLLPVHVDTNYAMTAVPLNRHQVLRTYTMAAGVLTFIAIICLALYWFFLRT